MAKTLTLTAIDIGTNSVKLLVGQKELGKAKVDILAQEQVPHFIGVRKGEVYNPKVIGETILSLKESLQQKKGLRIKKAFCNINGPHLFSLRSQGLVSVSRADQKISHEDIQRVLQASQAVNLPSNKEVLDVYPTEFIVDSEKGIKEPLGLQGIRLEAKVLLISVFSPVLENLGRAVYEAGIEIEEVIPSILASSRAVLTQEQKELGAAVVDIGAGTTSLAIFGEGNLQDFAVFPLGSANITNDIAIGLRTEIATAEKIKKDLGSLGYGAGKRKKKGEKIEIKDRELSFSRNFLNNIVKWRVSEIFNEVAKVLKKTTKETVLPGGVVLTGGGASLSGITEFARQKFELPCKVAGPKGIPGLEDFSFSTVVGLLRSGFDFYEEGKERSKGEGAKAKLKKFFKIFLP